MMPPNKKQPAASRIPLCLKHQPTQPHQFKPVVVQSKNAVPGDSSKRHIAPLAHRPLTGPRAVQTKIGSAPLTKTHSAVPPIYRPQSAPRVLERKMFVDPKRKPGVAYKPGGPPVAQAKMAGQVAAGPGPGVIQLTLCWLWVNGRQKTNGKGPQGSFEAKNGTKPPFHAERQAWDKNAANAR